jgi:hypothetical protein
MGSVMGKGKRQEAKGKRQEAEGRRERQEAEGRRERLQGFSRSPLAHWATAILHQIAKFLPRLQCVIGGGA